LGEILVPEAVVISGRVIAEGDSCLAGTKVFMFDKQDNCKLQEGVPYLIGDDGVFSFMGAQGQAVIWCIPEENSDCVVSRPLLIDVFDAPIEGIEIVGGEPSWFVIKNSGLASGVVQIEDVLTGVCFFNKKLGPGAGETVAALPGLYSMTWYSQDSGQIRRELEISPKQTIELEF